MNDVVEILKDPATRAQYAKLSPEYRAAFEWRTNWLLKAHSYQIPPPGDWWDILLLLAGRGAGKTRTAAEQLGWWAWQNPNTRWVVAAPTSSDVRSTCFEGDSGLLSVIPSVLVKDYNKALHELTLVNGSLIKGIPASEPERFRGPQFHGGWCDELAAWEYLQDAWDMMQFGLRLGKKVRLICTTTPKPKDLILDLVDRQGDDVALVTASTYENLDNLADNFRKQILQYEGTKLGRQEIYAELIDPEEGGMVKREHFRLWPVNKPFPKFEYIIQSYDCAYTEKTVNDPTAATTWGVFKPEDGPMSVMLIDAWQDRLQYPDLRPKVIEEFKVSFGADPEDEERGNYSGGKKVDLVLIEDKAAGISLIQDLQRAHLPVRAYNPGRADKIQRLSIVANIISHKRVWIPESSTRKGYVRDWAEGFVSQICSFPESTHDDFVDSCLIGSTQVLMADGSEKRLYKVVVGDMVKTPNGAQQVVKTFNNGEKEIWMVSAGGQMLLGTGDHRVMTGRGWIRIDSLIPNEDTVLMYPQEVIWRSQRSLRSLPRRFTSMVGSTTATLKARIQRIADTLQGLALDCIGMFGNTTTALFPTGTTFITSMVTPATTTSATSNASQPPITGQSIEKSCESETPQSVSGSISTESELKPLNGTSQTKAASGTASTRLTLWQRLGMRLAFILRSLCSVSGAVATWLQRRLDGFIAAPNAKLPKASSVLVKAVFNTHTTQTVYDLTVDQEHCYYADGMLVHNCTQALRYLRDAGFLDIDPRLEEDQEVEYYGRKKGNPYAI
jgi:phage terminase large subunit-like protein